MTACRLLLSLILTCTVASPVMSTDNRQPPMPPQELIVKFATGSEIHKATVEAMQSGMEKNANLESLTRGLSEEVEIPLVLRKITSGQEVVLAVDGEQQLRELTRRLEQREDIEYMQANTMMQPSSNTD